MGSHIGTAALTSYSQQPVLHISLIRMFVGGLLFAVVLFLLLGSCDSEGVYTTLCVGPVIGRREDDLKDGMTLCSS